MATGNLGDLEMSLTLKSRVEDEVKGIVRSMNSLDASGKRAQEAIDAISSAFKSMHKGTAEVTKLSAVLKKLNAEIDLEKSMEFPNAKTLTKLNKITEGLSRVKDILGQMSRDKANGFNIFPNGISSEVNAAQKAMNKLSGIAKELNKWEGKGLQLFDVKDTDNIRQASSELSKYRSVLEQIRNNGGTHPITGLTASDITKSAEYIAALDKAKVSAKEIKQAIVDANLDAKISADIEKERQQLMAKEAAEKENLNKKEQEYQLRQQAILDLKKQQADEQKRKLEAEINATRTLIDLQNQLNHTANMAEKGVLSKGLGLGADTTNLSANIGELRNFANSLNGVNPATMGVGSNKAFADYKSDAKSLTYALQEAALAQRELNAAKNAANKEAKRNQDKADAQAKRDAAKAANEYKAALKQLDREIEQAKQRIQSMEKALANLQEKRFTSKMLGLDTTEADAKIAHMKNQLADLRDILNGLNTRGVKAIGQIGSIGNGREVQAANNLAAIYDKVNKEAERGVRLEEQRKQKIAESASKVRSDLVKGFEQASNAASKMNSALSDIKSLFLQGGIVYGAWQFANSIIQTGGEMEKQHIALQSILGDMQNANTMFNQIKELALNSPFTFSELNRDVKQLAAYGVEYDQLYDTTKRLADMSSGLGVSFDRIALAFGQVQARGWLDGKELRQIAYAGIPLLSKLSEYYSKIEGKNVSTSEIKTRISKREVSFDDVKNIFWQMTNEGGQFYNMQQTLSETLLGRYNKLKDAWEIMLSEFASGNSLVGGFFKTALDGATALVQALNKLGGPVAAIVAGYGIKKMLAGGVTSSFLSNKAGIASNIQSNILQGKQVSQMERQILATKNQITSTDLRMLASEKALTVEKLNQLRISGQITAEQYRTYRGIVLRQTGEKGIKIEMQRTLVAMRSMSLSSSFKDLWTSFATSAQAAIGIVSTGLKSLGATLWSAIGGLPGLIITGLTFGITYAISSYRELSQKISQTQDEIASRQTQINKFLQENNAGAAIGSGDTKQIDNMIDAYKEKLKELAPYSYKNMLMSADEEKSHEDRLKYLEKELKLLRDANALASTKMSNRSFYSSLEDSVKSAQEKLIQRQEMRSAAMQPGASQGDIDAYKNEKAYNDYVNKIKNIIAKKFSDIGEDEKMREAAMQAMNGIFSELGVPEDKADVIRTSVLQAFGCGGKSGWLKSEVGNSMISLIDTTFPMIGAKIKASIPLTDAEKAKVKELMQDAKQGLINQYPELETTLKNMLAASNFQAVIKLVYDTGDKYNETQSELTGRIPGMVDGNLGQKYRRRAEEYGKDNSWYSARNTAKTNIDTAFNNWDSAKESDAKNTAQLWQEYQDEMSIARTLLHYNYKGEGKKSNKPGKKNTGRQEDKELKALEERLSSYKSARQSYQKRQSYMSDEAAKKETYKLFPEVTGLNLDNYESAVKSLLNGFKINTTERKKFQTSVYREVADWLFEEGDKKEFEKKAATFSEDMNKLSDRWDLYKSLLEKTGNKDYASAAWIDAFQEDEKTKSLMDEYYAHYGKIFNLQDALSLSDGEAKEKFKLPNEYEEWKKIVDLLRGNYVQALNDGADIYEKTASYAEKILVIQEKYNKLIKDAGDNTDLKARYNQQKNKEIGAVRMEEFKNSPDYLNFYGAIVSLGTEKAQAIGAKIRQNINEALQSGAIDAREYSKELQQLEEQLLKLTKPRATFLNGGLTGLAEKKVSDANEQFTLATSKISQGQKAKDLGEQIGDENLIKRGESMINSGKAMQDAALVLFKDGTKAKETLDKFSSVVNAIDQNVQGMCDAFNEVKETATNLGVDTDSDGWQDASAFFESFSGMSSSLSKVVSSAESGNVGGILSGAVGVITSPINAFAKAHDAKLNRQINLAERQLTELKNLSSNISSAIQSTLGGIYSYNRTSATANKLSSIKSDYSSYQAFANSSIGKTFFGGKNLSRYSEDTYNSVLGTDSNISAYQDQLALLNAERDELQKKRNSEAKKKNSDEDKLADYDQQITEMEQSLQAFAQDFLKNIYSIDMKSWASELTDTVVSAWSAGEDAVDAYREKVKDMVKDVTKNIVSQKIMEKALQKPLDYLTGVLDEKGQLDETDMDQLATMLYSVGDTVVPQLEGVFEALKNRGWDLSDNGSSSSTTNSVKSITEETADLLCSYVNAIRADVSVNRENIKLIADAVGDMPDLTIIARSQLTSLNQLVSLAEARNDKLDDMYSWMRAVTSGTGSKSISVN